MRKDPKISHNIVKAIDKAVVNGLFTPGDQLPADKEPVSSFGDLRVIGRDRVAFRRGSRHVTGRSISEEEKSETKSAACERAILQR